MPTLTKLTPTKQGRMALFFDGDFAFSVDLETLAKKDLREGRQLSEEELDDLRHETEYQKAKARAFYLLGFKSYTRKMMEEKLLREEFGAETVQEVIERLTELGYLNDFNYARCCSRDLVNLKHYSHSRVRQELQHRGVEEWDIEQALTELEDDPAQQIESILRKKYWNSLHLEKGQRRAINGLMRLGYSYGEIREVLNDLLSEWDDEIEMEE